MKKTVKKSVILVIYIFVLPLIFSACGNHTNPEPDTLLRLHIRANSNSPQDQAVKLACRDAVTEYLERELAAVTDLETAMREITVRFSALQTMCDNVLKGEGFLYESRVRLANEFFPTRSYENLILESGCYDALIIELGTGAGDNWWCVIYPPLCYLEAKGGSGVVYKSKIAELIEKWFK